MAQSKTTPLSDAEQVTQHIQKLDPAISPIVEAIRKIILSTDKEIGDQIKWNSPAFYYTGEMKPFNPKDTTGILEGDYSDGRRLVRFKDMADVKAKTKAIQSVIKDWLSLVDK